jgi:hypothetical protein
MVFFLYNKSEINFYSDPTNVSGMHICIVFVTVYMFFCMYTHCSFVYVYKSIYFNRTTVMLYYLFLIDKALLFVCFLFNLILLRSIGTNSELSVRFFIFFFGALYFLCVCAQQVFVFFIYAYLSCFCIFLCAFC